MISISWQLCISCWERIYRASWSERSYRGLKLVSVWGFSKEDIQENENPQLVLIKIVDNERVRTASQNRLPLVRFAFKFTKALVIPLRQATNTVAGARFCHMRTVAHKSASRNITRTSARGLMPVTYGASLCAQALVSDRTPHHALQLRH